MSVLQLIIIFRVDQLVDYFLNYLSVYYHWNDRNFIVFSYKNYNNGWWLANTLKVAAVVVKYNSQNVPACYHIHVKFTFKTATHYIHKLTQQKKSFFIARTRPHATVTHVLYDWTWSPFLHTDIFYNISDHNFKWLNLGMGDTDLKLQYIISWHFWWRA